MEHLRICKAEPVYDGQVIEGMTIIIDDNIPTTIELQEHFDFFQLQAESLAGALISSLPHGILIRLIAALLGHMARQAGFIGTLN